MMKRFLAFWAAFVIFVAFLLPPPQSQAAKEKRAQGPSSAASSQGEPRA